MIDNFGSLLHMAHIMFHYDFGINNSRTRTRYNFAILNTIYKLVDKNNKNRSQYKSQRYKAGKLHHSCIPSNLQYMHCIDSPLHLNNILVGKPNMLYYFCK